MELDNWIELLPVYGENYLSWDQVAEAYRDGLPFQVSDGADILTRSQVNHLGYRATLRYGYGLRRAGAFYEWQHAGE